MRAFRAIVELTLRALVGRRRTLTIALLALPAGPARACSSGSAAGGRDAPEILDTLVHPDGLPLVALVIGTGAIGSEIEDGTLIFQLHQAGPALADWPREESPSPRSSPRSSWCRRSS